MMKFVRAGTLLALAALASCQGESTTSSDPTTRTSISAPAPGSQGVTLSTSGAGLVERRTAKGVSVQLDGRFEQAVIARRNADGSISTECHDEQAEADAFAVGTTPAAHTLEVQ